MYAVKIDFSKPPPFYVTFFPYKLPKNSIGRHGSLTPHPLLLKSLHHMCMTPYICMQL